MTSTLEWMGQGAALGTAVFPGIGTGVGAALGGLASLATQVFPGLDPHLSGPKGEALTAALAPAFQAIVGTSDPTIAATVLAQDPALSAQLRVQLQQLVNDQATIDLHTTEANISNTKDARATMLSLSTSHSPNEWGAPLISILVLSVFGFVVSIALNRTMPVGSEPILNVLLGTLGAMSMSVVNFWVGSSSGSQRKDQVSAVKDTLLANSVPAELVRGTKS